MPAAKKKYSVEGATSRDIDDMVRKHAADSGSGGADGKNNEEISAQYATFIFFGAVATALPVYFFMTPIFQLSLADHLAQVAATALASIVMLVMAYIEISVKVLKGLKGKKKLSGQNLTCFSQAAGNTAVFHVNAAYVVLAVINALYLMPLYGSSETSILTLSVAGSAALVLGGSKIF